MVDLILMALVMALTVCFIFFMAYLIDLHSVYGDEQEMEKRTKARRENPKNVYFILVALATTVLNILLIRLAPNKPMPGSGLENIYYTMSGLALFFYFSGVYFLGKKLALKEPLEGRFLVSAIFVNICVWPLVLFFKIMS
jgi:hypothetical protein